jgi:hypothetical protein
MDGRGYSELNVEENGFLNEFKLAMANLQANVAAGRAQRLPISAAAPARARCRSIWRIQRVARREQPGRVRGGNWTNSTFVGRLAYRSPSVSNAANDLDGNSGRRANALAAGMRESLCRESCRVRRRRVSLERVQRLQRSKSLRRRMSKGFQINGSYQYALENGSAFLGRHYGRVLNPTANVRHAFKMQWDWSVPVGRGRHYGTDMPTWLDMVLGGWEFNGAGRIQARTLNFGNVRMVGMTLDELTSEYRFRLNPDALNPGRQIVTMLPDDIILNTRRAFNTSVTNANRYSDLGAPEGRASRRHSRCTQFKTGDCAPRTTLVRAPWFSRFDVSLAKKFVPRQRVNFEVRLNMLNVFDAINFTPVANPGTQASIFQVTAAYQDINNTFDPGGRVGEIVFRINW